MIVAGILDTLKLVLPKKKTKAGGQSQTSTFDPGAQGGLISLPQYRDHLQDIFSSRSANDSRELLKQLFKYDPDVSAALNGYLTMANTRAIILARDLEGNIDRDATKSLMGAISKITRQTDYTNGFQLKRALNAVCEDLRYMCLLRGAIGAELVFDKQALPENVRIIDMAQVEWLETKPGEYKPQQAPEGSNDKISLDIPTFFVSFYRKDPTSIYGESSFVSAINTIAARQQVINDLYRIMQITGFPRLSLKIVEETLLKAAPANIKTDQAKLREWMTGRFNEISSAFTTLRPDQPMIHFDSVEPGMLNEKMPGAAVDIDSVIETLNAQNQAGLKTMATMIGRGTQGVNTGSVEARIAAMNADELNEPVAEILEKMLSFILHMGGFQGFAEVYFEKAELRPELELEPQKTMRQSRLLQDLSHGNITDDEYHLWMYGRLRPDSAPELSGTGFMQPVEAASVDASKVTPNNDPLGRSLTSPDAKSARSKTVKKPPKK